MCQKIMNFEVCVRQHCTQTHRKVYAKCPDKSYALFRCCSALLWIVNCFHLLKTVAKFINKSSLLLLSLNQLPEAEIVAENFRK